MRHHPLRSKKRRFILLVMVEFRYRGREITQEDILYICSLIERHPNDSRRKLSTRLCEAWQWRQTNGTLRDMVCRGMLLMLERAGQISLPPVSYARHNPLAHRVRPEPVPIDTTPIEDRLRGLQPLVFEQVRRTGREPLFNSLIEEHHYLGYEQPGVEHLTSHILGRMAVRISDDWQRMYGHPIYFLETFVDPERFRGTCYRAANWVVLGKTTGRGKQSNSYLPNRSIKEVLGYPLAKQFRELLMGPG